MDNIYSLTPFIDLTDDEINIAIKSLNSLLEQEPVQSTTEHSQRSQQSLPEIEITDIAINYSGVYRQSSRSLSSDYGFDHSNDVMRMDNISINSKYAILTLNGHEKDVLKDPGSEFKRRWCLISEDNDHIVVLSRKQLLEISSIFRQSLSSIIAMLEEIFHSYKRKHDGFLVFNVPPKKSPSEFGQPAITIVKLQNKNSSKPNHHIH